MGGVIVQVSMSLDGYIAGQDDEVDRLHQWMFAGDGPGTGLTGADQEIFDELHSETGAMISGRRLYNITRGWHGSRPFGGIPVFIVTYAATPPPRLAQPLHPRRRWDRPTPCQSQAGGRSIYIIGGASTRQQFLDADLAELRIDLIPSCSAAASRYSADPRRTGRPGAIQVTASEHITHLQCRIPRPAPQ